MQYLVSDYVKISQLEVTEEKNPNRVGDWCLKALIYKSKKCLNNMKDNSVSQSIKRNFGWSVQVAEATSAYYIST